MNELPSESQNDERFKSVDRKVFNCFVLKSSQVIILNGDFIITSLLPLWGVFPAPTVFLVLISGENGKFIEKTFSTQWIAPKQTTSDCKFIQRGTLFAFFD